MDYSETAMQYPFHNRGRIRGGGRGVPGAVLITKVQRSSIVVTQVTSVFLNHGAQLLIVSIHLRSKRSILLP